MTAATKLTGQSQASDNQARLACVNPEMTAYLRSRILCLRRPYSCP